MTETISVQSRSNWAKLTLRISLISTAAAVMSNVPFGDSDIIEKTWKSTLSARSSDSTFERPPLKGWEEVLEVLRASLQFEESDASVTEQAPIDEALLKHWSSKETQHLFEALNRIRNLGEGWDGFASREPRTDSISAAERVAALLPQGLGEPSVGVDEEGYVFLIFQKGRNAVFLTIESAKMHLLVKRHGSRNSYLDDVPFDLPFIPPTIQLELEKVVRET